MNAKTRIVITVAKKRPEIDKDSKLMQRLKEKPPAEQGDPQPTGPFYALVRALRGS